MAVMLLVVTPVSGVTTSFTILIDQVLTQKPEKKSSTSQETDSLQCETKMLTIAEVVPSTDILDTVMPIC